MKGKIFIILLLIALLGYIVHEMLQYEESIRSEKVIREYIEGERAPLVAQPSPEDLDQMASRTNYYFQTDGNGFKALQFNNESKSLQWEPLLMKGVNLGVAVPGKFPAEFSLSGEEYLQWLELIGDMNANTIRTYTILPPEFYNAFAQYNLLHQDKPLYLLQGVWATVPDTHDYLDKAYSRTMEKEIADVIDVLHGHAVLPPQKGKADGVYSTDVSKYVAGLLFGREWEPDGVSKTNRQNTGHRFQGDFIGVHDASPMEIWLAQMMNFIVLYETMTYNMQHPVSFVNWLPLDPLFHNEEFIENEKVREYDNDLEIVDFMHFHAGPAFLCGIFAAYHAYPYYPDFVYLSPEYASVKNRNGSPDNYLGYLTDLKSHHMDMPVVIAEYGLPSSRGNSHQTPYGLDQGGHDERAHARLNSQLTRDIFASGCTGAIYFEWADEWFKHNWLVMDFEIPFEHRNRWHNMENPEQNFGVLALEAKKKTIDGRLDDWDLPETDRRQGIYTASDPAYFYMAIPLKEWTSEKENIYIALDVVPGDQGDHRLPFSPAQFENGFEFLLEFMNSDSARILVDEPYSVFTDIYNDRIPGYRSVPNQNGRFIEQVLLSNRSRESLTGSRFDSVLFNRSRLVFGNSEEPGNSNADWYFNDTTGVLEIRLTWHLINVTDPSTGCILDNVGNTPAIECSQTPGLAMQFFVTDEENRELYRIPETDPHFHAWQTWEKPTFQQRRKPLYDSLRVCFKNCMYDPAASELAEHAEGTVTVCPFYKDHPKALSLRFDKGAYSQFERALPLLQKYRLKATFAIDPEVIQARPGYVLTPSGQRLKTMGSSEIVSIREAGHQISAQETSKCEVNIRASELSAGALLQKLEEENKDWVVLQYENITEWEQASSGVAQIPPGDFEKQIRLMRNAGYWIAPEEAVFYYREAQKKANIRINRYGPFQFITIAAPLDPEVFDHPLSFYFYTQAPKVEVSGSEDDGFYQARNGKVLLHAKPGREVSIKQIW